MATLSAVEVRAVIRWISPDLGRFAGTYPEAKYPAKVLERLRRVFGHPEDVTEADIVDALVWKYGHTGKANYPQTQRALAGRIAALWRTLPIRSGRCHRAMFEQWRRELGPTGFITARFLLHLAKPRAFPILDQHNFRSINHYLARLRPGRIAKAKPRQLEDLLLVKCFGEEVRRHWSKHSQVARLSADVLDRYLMMHGKSLKPSGRKTA